MEVNFFLFRSIRLSSHGVRARSIPAVSTVDCECIRCKMQKTISAVYRTNSGMPREEARKRERERERGGRREISKLENLWKCIFPHGTNVGACGDMHFCSFLYNREYVISLP